MTEVSVTPKGQVTIPIEIRKKHKITPGSKVEITEEDGKITIRKVTSIIDLAGAGSHISTPEEVKKELDEMRKQDAR
ncbi:AbrB/MazE/SpoVT family DNA-binding domain-containing protein [Candidatus Bathyarchaeota archaeon]|jgi:AbrB family looped-hinge helix DNA binding protein|nr:MAG: AbrB/MazE/SpoVT family DNA-binding domain-containing protein [Candidatus Bathyarchaeota archaeon]